MKKLVTLIFILVFIFTLIRCSKSDSLVVYPQISIHYVDSTGHDLFVNGANGYYKDSVLIFNLQNGVPSLIYLANSMYPYGYYFAYNILGGKLTLDTTYAVITNSYTILVSDTTTITVTDQTTMLPKDSMIITIKDSTVTTTRDSTVIGPNHGTMIIGTFNLPVANNSYTTNIIQVKPGKNDTLRAHVNGMLYDSIWYNGILKKDTMTIVK